MARRPNDPETHGAVAVIERTGPATPITRPLAPLLGIDIAVDSRGPAGTRDVELRDPLFGKEELGLLRSGDGRRQQNSRRYEIVCSFHGLDLQFSMRNVRLVQHVAR